jgi:hypothetical protein
MAYDHTVSLSRKDGSEKKFHIYGRPTPKPDDVITLPVDGRPIKARISGRSRDDEMTADEMTAVET